MKLNLNIRKPDLRGTDEPRKIDRKNVVAAESSSACSRKKKKKKIQNKSVGSSISRTSDLSDQKVGGSNPPRRSFEYSF